MGKIKETAFITGQYEIADGIYDLWISTKIANEAKPGQFVSFYTKDGSRLLPRPISICEIAGDGLLRVVYRVVGKGTEEFSKLDCGDEIEIAGPMGNGFPLLDKKAILIGGGIGIPPMYELAKQLNCEKTVVLGYRDQLFLNEGFEEIPDTKVVIATEDGSKGTKGNVIDAIKEMGIEGDVIYACGPIPMLRGVKAYAKEKGITAYISMEEKMACGVGACLGCVCKSTEVDDHSKVNNKRVCKDGPVFNAEEVDI